MKRCPQCNRFENDEALTFCRVDGATLITESSNFSDEAGTAQLPSDASEVHTNMLPHRRIATTRTIVSARQLDRFAVRQPAQEFAHQGCLTNIGREAADGNYGRSMSH